MDLERYFELRTLLQRWRMTLAESLRRRIEASPRLARWLERIYNSEGTDEPFNVWLDRWCRQAAIQFILRILFLRVLEDRELLGATRIRTGDGQRMWAQLTRNLGAASYVQFCFWDAGHLLPDLFEPGDYDLALPADDLVQRFLDDVWRRPDPDRPGWLRFDFRPDPARRDAGFQTRFIGDLYQELDAEIRERYALLQTPDFISQFILENTLLKRFEEMDFREVTLMDPTCGSGHFEVDAFWMFVARYEAAAGKSREQMTAVERTQIARDIIERHLFGCDINPYATALTRFRLVLAACDYARPASLRDFRDLRFNIVTIDSLIPYERLMVGGVSIGTELTRGLGQPTAIEKALPILRRQYTVIVGNPPYIMARDPVKRDIYREHYRAAHWKFALSAPFVERFLQLASPEARVGLIVSNSFAARQFGLKLVEQVLPKVDLEAILDLSGVYVPGHGTPTLIMMLQNRPPQQRDVLVVSSLRGEPDIPADPAHGKAWTSVKEAFNSTHHFEDKFVSKEARSRAQLGVHPWQFGRMESQLYSRLQDGAGSRTVSALAEVIGFGVVTGADDIFLSDASCLRRLGFPQHLQKPMVIGDAVRDWEAAPSGQVCVFPYDDAYKVVDVAEHPSVAAYFEAFRDKLSKRRGKGFKTAEEQGRQWYEFGFYYPDRFFAEYLISFAEIATHNHFVLVPGGRLYHHSAPIIKMREIPRRQAMVLVGVLNSNTICFCLKQICFDKRSGKNPVSDTYHDFAGTMVGKAPLPRHDLIESPGSHHMYRLVEELIDHAIQLPALTQAKILEKSGEAHHAWNRSLDDYLLPHSGLPPSFTTARELHSVRERLIALRQDLRGRMIFLQEEMDWLAYEMYGLIKKAPLGEDYLSESQYRDARLELGQRPFELAGKGYTGDWPPGYQPTPLDEALRGLTDARIAIIRTNPDIALLEDPLYKRRWVPPDYDAEFREAAAWWLAEKLEWALEQARRPLSLREWARLMGQDERVNATLEVLTGAPTFDLEAELLKVIRANAVPNLPEHYLKASGLRKLYAALDERRRMTDNSPPPVPEFAREDFSDGTAWRLRGKLNIPRERFITYAEFDSARGNNGAPDSGGPWFGWAGWDAAARADALAHLLDRAQRAGWEVRWRQCGLRAALRDLLPELKELPPADRAEFESIAGICGIGLSATCFCQAYRDAFARGEAGVPGVGEEALGVKVVVQEEVRRPAGRGRKPKKTDIEQPGLFG